MIAALLTSWAVAAGCALLALRMRGRLARVADAEHELRGALTAFGLAVEGFARTPAGRWLAATLESELLRARAALADITPSPSDAARPVPVERLVRSATRAWRPLAGGRRLDVDWRAGGEGQVSSPGRAAQALGNLVSNAVEHGEGPVAVRSVAVPGAVRVEVTNTRSGASGPGPYSRGRGLRIAAGAAQAAGGRLAVGADRERVTAALELPVEP